MQIVQVDDNDREKEATRHFLSHLRFRGDLLSALGMNALTWVVMEAQKPHLIPGLVGDVDILAGDLEFKDQDQFVNALRQAEKRWPGMDKAGLQNYACKLVTEADGLKWPPASTRIIGVEVKCGYFDREEGPRSTKSSPKNVEGTRGQMERLMAMGLDMVALLDVIGNDPTEGQGAYLEAAGRARDSARAFQPIIAARLPDNTPAAQFFWAVGSVFDRDERFSGAGGLHKVRHGLPNPLVEAKEEATMRNRETLLKNASEMLATIPPPRYCPVFFIDCQDCGRLHFLEDSACWKPKAKAPKP